jgi:hypothetical protein
MPIPGKFTASPQVARGSDRFHGAMNRTCRRRDRLSGIVASGVAVLALAACTTDVDASTDTDRTSAESTETGSTDTVSADSGSTETGSTETASPETTAMDLGGVGTLATDETHEISLVIDDAEYAEMLDTYRSTGDKEWIDATITIDGAEPVRALVST